MGYYQVVIQASVVRISSATTIMVQVQAQTYHDVVYQWRSFSLIRLAFGSVSYLLLFLSTITVSPRTRFLKYLLSLVLLKI